MPQKTRIEKITSWVGSVSSLTIHTVVFASSFLLAVSGLVPWSFMLLVLTTVLSLEAIYLAIFIQMTVNRQALELAEVSEDVGDIQEDIQEITQDVGEIQKDVDEIQEDVGEIQEDVEDIQEDVGELQENAEEEVVAPAPSRAKPHAPTLDEITQEVRRLLATLEQMKQ